MSEETTKDSFKQVEAIFREVSEVLTDLETTASTSTNPGTYPKTDN